MNLQICDLKIRCFVQGLHQFSSHPPKCHVCHGICTLSPLDAALTMRFAKFTQHDTSEVPLRLPCEITMEVGKVCCACHEKCNASSEKVAKVLRLLHKTTFDTLRNTSECHELPCLCHAKRRYAGLEASKSDHFCRTRYTALTRSPANGCDRKGDVDRTHPQTPDQSETGTLATHSGKMWGASNNQWESIVGYFGTVGEW